VAGVGRNFSAALLTQVVSWALALVTNLFLPGYLEPKQFAQFALAIAFSTGIGSLIGQGVGRLLVRDIAREPDRAGEYLRAALLLRIPQWLAGIVAGTVLPNLLGYPDDTRLLIQLATTVMIVQQCHIILIAVLQGLERFQRSNVSQMAEKAGMVGAVLVLVLLRQPLWTFVIATTAGPTVGLAINSWTLARVLRETARGSHPPRNVSTMGYLWRESGTLMAGQVFFALKDPLNQVMMSRFAGPEAGAWFALAYRLIGSSMIVPVAMATVTMPRMARALAMGGDSFRKEVAQQLRTVFLLTVPISALLVFATVPLLELLHFYPKYAGAVPVFRVWGSALALWSISVVAANALVAADGQSQVARFSLWALAIHPFSSALCIRGAETVLSNGAVGSVVANILIELFLMANFVLRLPKGSVRLIEWDRLLRSVAAAVPTAFLLSRIESKEQLWIVLPAMAVYAVGCLVFRAVGAEEMAMLSRVVGKFVPGARGLRGAGGKP
jgi:O-antigen/teichoic acid export membrane protein